MCGYHQDFESVICPFCNKHKLFKETNSSKQATVIIMDKKDIGDEIIAIERQNNEGKIYNERDISTSVKKDEFIKEREEDIKNSIQMMSEKVEEK